MKAFQPEKMSLRRALTNLFWIGIMLPLPAVGLAKLVTALVRL